MPATSSKKRKTRVPGRLARLMALMPTSSALLYPWYLAAQLDTVRDERAYDALPEAFSGLRIAFFSDVHYGVLFKEDRVRALVERVNALTPDLIIMGGDYGEDPHGAIRFFELTPRFQARWGVLAAIGNHDRMGSDDNSLESLKTAMLHAGVIPLVNDAWLLKREGRTLAFAGIDDFYNGCPDWERVRAGCAEADFTVFIPHTPDVLPQIAASPDGVFYDLLLCGHTHGGQVAVLGHSVHPTAKTGDRYRSGWYHENGADILVTNGVGTTGFPVRLGARPQLHLITLKHAK